MKPICFGQLLCLCFLLVLNAGVSLGLKWEDEDSIGIDAEAEPKSLRSKRQFDLGTNYAFGYGSNEIGIDGIDYDETNTDFNLGYANAGGNHGTEKICATRTGERGVCATLSDCYPVLYTMTAYRGERNITNFPLAEDLIRNSGPCSSNPKDLLNNIICCPTIYEGRYSVRRPNRPPLRAPSTPVSPNCGRGKVTHPTEAPRGTYPWIAALMMRGRQFCGGSLIDDYHVLTAAHCVSHFSANDINNLRIYLGAHDLYSVKDQDEGRVVAAASRVTFHRGFSHQTLLNDVALIRLAQRVDYTRLSNIEAICLTAGIPAYDRGYPWVKLAGWGKLYNQGPQPSRLQHTDLQIVPQEECRRRYGRIPPAGYLPDHDVCATSRRGSDACQGDSGGPLMRYLLVATHPKKAYRVEQIGIVSWGVDCGALPGVYVRPDHFTAWLNKNRYG